MKLVNGLRLCCVPQQLLDGELLLLKWRPRGPDMLQLCYRARRSSLLRSRCLLHLPDRSALDPHEEKKDRRSIALPSASVELTVSPPPE